MMGAARWKAGKLPQRLQIDEVCDVAREFLDSKRIVGLERSYLPSGLRIQVAAGDFESLQPFQEELRRSLQAVVNGLAERAGFRRGSAALLLELMPDSGREEGSAPLLTAGFPVGESEVRWIGGRRSDGRGSAAEIQLVFTAMASSHTGVQEHCEVVLQQSASPVDTTSGDEQPLLVPNPFARRPVAGCRCPAALEQTDLAARQSCGAGGGVRRVFADDGALLIGRDDNCSHLVPIEAPLTMSRKHCALVAGRDGDVHVVDLGSGNGTRVGSTPCRPFESVRLHLPAAIVVGQRDLFQIEVLAK